MPESMQGDGLHTGGGQEPGELALPQIIDTEGVAQRVALSANMGPVFTKHQPMIMELAAVPEFQGCLMPLVGTKELDRLWPNINRASPLPLGRHKDRVSTA